MQINTRNSPRVINSDVNKINVLSLQRHSTIKTESELHHLPDILCIIPVNSYKSAEIYLILSPILTSTTTTTTYFNKFEEY